MYMTITKICTRRVKVTIWGMAQKLQIQRRRIIPIRHLHIRLQVGPFTKPRSSQTNQKAQLIIKVSILILHFHLFRQNYKPPVLAHTSMTQI